ncbi:LytR/AlgR family response regulator transcription factor [Aquimarina agarivorans]|uniref:LytR/AlgR family response regulator transcription factor n=1 Tax=Aquimarina agarivorans TaxID=980584 RepID=UPI000248FD5B|nr:LytTR family DNA-binding domain-containing protein [Aquimarina agarivorans]
MTTVIIEDEKPSARRLKRMVEAMDIHVLQVLHSVEEAIVWYKANTHPDLVFLDIQLSDGLSFEIFDEVTIESSIIFTTAYDEYALKAFKLKSVDYLLKPIDQDELEFAVKKFKSQIKTSKPEVDFMALTKLLSSPPATTYKKRYTIKVGQHLKIFNVDDIECFYSENKGTYLHATGNRSYLMDTTLEQLENELDITCFYRISRKFFINITAIKDIVAYTNSRLELKLNHFDASEVIVSREKVKDFKAWLEGQV